jgi:hypothetical protein
MTGGHHFAVELKCAVAFRRMEHGRAHLLVLSAEPGIDDRHLLRGSAKLGAKAASPREIQVRLQPSSSPRAAVTPDRLASRFRCTVMRLPVEQPALVPR